jgi:hypothetical protein
VLCVGLLFFSRRRARHDPVRHDEPERPFDPELPAKVLPVPIRRLLRRPVDRTSALALPWKWVALGGIPLILFALVNTPVVWWQLLTLVPFAALVLWAFRRPDARGVLGVAAAACLAAAASFYVIQQFRHKFPPDFVWPQLFDRVHILGLLAIFLIGAEGVRELVFRVVFADRAADTSVE